MWKMPFGLTSTTSHREAASTTLTPQTPLKTKLKTSFGSKVAAPLKLKLSPPRSVLRPPSPINANSKQQQQRQPQPHQQKSPSKIPTPTPKRSPPSKDHTSDSRPSSFSPSPPTPFESSKSKKSVIPNCASSLPDSPSLLVSRLREGRGREGQGTPPPGASCTAPAPAPGLTRVPSRTQLRHASAARRLSVEGLLPEGASDNNSNSAKSKLSPHTAPGALGAPDGTGIDGRNEDRNKVNAKLRAAPLGPGPDSPRPASGRYKKQAHEPEPGSRPSWAGLPSTVDLSASLQKDGAVSFAPKETRTGTLKRKVLDSAPDVPELDFDGAYVKPPPLLRKSLEAAGVKVAADSSNMETLLNNRDFLQATYMTPQSVLEKIYHEDSYYHVWVATRLAMEEKPLHKHELDEVVKLALHKFIIELGSALVDCLKPGLPLYTFVDPRRLMHTDGAKVVREQAIALVEDLEQKGISRERVYVSIPATETGLAVSKRLREENGIQTNLVFVSGLTQAIACVGAARAAAITMPFDKILGYHEELYATPYGSLNPHPGRQAIKATACYTKIHLRPHPYPSASPEKKEKVQVIASSLRSVIELEHCSALDMVVLEDEEVERTLKWTRMRVNRPPGEGSVCWKVAREAPAPEASASPSAASQAQVQRGEESDEAEAEAETIPYLRKLPLAERNLTASVLHSGLKCWQDGVRLIEDVLRREIERCIEVYRAPLTWELDVGSGTEMQVEVEVEVERKKERDGRKGKVAFPRSSGSRSVWEEGDDGYGEEEMDENAPPPRSSPSLRPSTPSTHQLQGYGYGYGYGYGSSSSSSASSSSRAESSEPPSVPQSPYWTDVDSFESEDSGTGNSSDDDDDDDEGGGAGERKKKKKKKKKDMVLF